MLRPNMIYYKDQVVERVGDNELSKMLERKEAVVFDDGLIYVPLRENTKQTPYDRE